MSIPTIDQILTPLTPAQARAKVQAILVAAKIPANLWAKGGVASTLLTGAGNILSMLSGQLSRVVGGFFLPTAAADPQGGLIGLLAQYMYGIAVPQATFATGPLTLTNSGGGSYTGGSYGAGLVFFLGSNGQSYTNVTPLNLGPVSSPTATQTITIEATVAGSVGSANPNTVTTLVTSLLGVSCTNSAPIVGLDALTNAAVESLCLASIGFRSPRGPGTAYAYAISGLDPVTGAPLALNLVTQQQVNINRWTIAPSSRTGQTTIYIASPSGAVDPNDLAAVILSVNLNATPDGVTVTVLPANPVPYSPTLTPWVQAPSSVSAAELQTAIATALTAYMSSKSNPIGGVTAADDLHPAGITGVLGDQIKGVVAGAVAPLGCVLVGLQGALDLPLGPTELAIDVITVNLPRLVSVSGVA